MPEPRPNVVIVITDDQGYGDLACHGNPVARTPNLDALHSESVRLEDFHAAPMCTPSRGQLLTGLDAARNGALNVSSGRTLLCADLPTLADLFRDAGYSTGLFGKWHLGDNYPYRPQDRGFDESLWFPSSHISSLPDYWENDYFDDVYSHNGTRERQEGYCTEVFFREAKRWMDGCIRDDQPFFAYLPTNAPHYPLFVPAEDRAVIEAAFEVDGQRLPELPDRLRGDIIRFLAMIHNVDRQVGALRDFLREQDVERDTVFIFMTDNGSTFGSTYYNAGMRGKKCELWEGGHRVPCFIHWPGGGLREPGAVHGLTEMQDLLPTFMDFCGLSRPAEAAPLDGISLSGVLRGETNIPEDRMLTINYSRMPGAFDYPSPSAPSVVRRTGAAVLWKRWRLLGGAELYDLDADPAQTTNVIDEHPEEAAQMRTHLNAWWEAVEPTANAVQRITVGHDAENPMMLSACEWWDVFVDQQRQVRIGEQRNSYWHLDVHRAGTYDFELMRWPPESGLSLRDACTATELTDGALDAGTALPIASARMMVGEVAYEQDASPDDTAVRFSVELDAGPTLLHTWFYDDRDQPICGAYYVRVTARS